MSKLLRKVLAQYQAAETRVETAEAEIQKASECRLSELMRREPRQRLEQIEDPTLTAADRLKLRRSIAGNLRHGKRHAFFFGSRAIHTQLRGWIRYMPAAVAVTAVIAPTAFAAKMAYNNTDKLVIVEQPGEVEWILPSGAIQRQILPAGARLAIARQSDSVAIARSWIEGQGYATARIMLVQH